jgi:hypothetical protein
VIWLTWRQYRTAALLTAAVGAVVLTVLLLTGPRLAHDYTLDGLPTCVATGAEPPGGGRTCGDLERAFLDSYRQVRGPLGVVVLGLPLFVGVFLGAPLLAREYENGTHRLAWTQSVSRTRWLVTRLVLVGGAAVAVTAIVTTLYTWWSGPADRLGSRVDPGTFPQRGILPVAYVAFAFALGVLVGAVARRALPAMVITLLLFLGVRTAVQSTVRPDLLDPVELSYPTFSFYADDPPNLMVADHGWVVGDPATVDRDGQVVGPGYPVADSVIAASCNLGTPEPSKRQLDECGQRLGLRDVMEVHPADSFWPLQLRESAIFAALAGASMAASFWWVRHRSG